MAAQVEKVKYSVLATIEKYCLEHNLPAIPREQGEFLAMLTRLLKPKFVVEVGTLVGYSTLWIAMNTECQVITCEHDSENAKRAQHNMALAGVNNVEIIVGDAKETLPTITQTIDLVFLDATKSEYMTYFHLLRPNLRSGSVIIADNIYTFPEKLKPYVEYMKSHYVSITLPYKNGMEMTIIS